jgi:hypothetical protein
MVCPTSPRSADLDIEGAAPQLVSERHGSLVPRRSRVQRASAIHGECEYAPAVALKWIAESYALFVASKKK